LIYFTSDEHYDHHNIIEFCDRPFNSVAHMQAELVARHNTMVGPDDVVYHLGDFALNKKTVPRILPRLNGKHYLVAGNHDACHPSKKGFVVATQNYYVLAGFVDVFHAAVEIATPWGLTLLAHMPPADDDTRYNEYRPKLRDLPPVLLHGHVHERYKYCRLHTTSRLDDSVQPRAIDCINVGVDQWGYAPVSIAQLHSYLRML
jgi:calcineurin-like phosphoesterase family protein